MKLERFFSVADAILPSYFILFIQLIYSILDNGLCYFCYILCCRWHASGLLQNGCFLCQSVIQDGHHCMTVLAYNLIGILKIYYIFDWTQTTWIIIGWYLTKFNFVVNWYSRWTPPQDKLNMECALDGPLLPGDSSTMVRWLETWT